MIHHSVTHFGARPVSACLLQGQHIAQMPATMGEVDKWAVFHALRKARSHFGLNNRDLIVLNALLTFHPQTKLVDGAQLIVYPSNASLADRAHGMAESTLRRHLAALVKAAVIARNDSPNGKRFAARSRTGTVVQAYGFDLRPLLVQADKILAMAELAEDAALNLKIARQRVITGLRDVCKLITYAEEIGQNISDPSQTLSIIRRKIRCKISIASLEEMATELGDILAEMQSKLPCNTKEVSGNDMQNERHHQRSDKESIESELTQKNTTVAASTNENLKLGLLLKACPDINPYSQGGIETWHDLCITADRVYSMMGISKSAWNNAQRHMGYERAAGVLAAMLQRIGEIKVPGGYLRRLTQLHCARKFSLSKMVIGLLNNHTPQTA